MSLGDGQGPLSPHNQQKAVQALRSHVTAITGAVVAEIRRQAPECDGGTVLRTAVCAIVTNYVDRIENPHAGRVDLLEQHQVFGAAELHSGRPIERLQACYRLGARAAWQRIARIGAEEAFAAVVVSYLAEELFTLVDDLARAAADGYRDAVATTGDTLIVWRRKLLHLVLASPQASRHAMLEMARLVRFDVSGELTPVVVRLGGLKPHLRELDGALAESAHGWARVLVPGVVNDRWTVALRAAFPKATVVVGPAGSAECAPEGERIAREVLELSRRGKVEAPSLIRAEEHLAELLLHSDRAVLDRLTAKALRPLKKLAEQERRVILETLECWLDEQGSVEGMGARLHIHPHTVRYRLRRLEEALGDQLREPRDRFALHLVVRSRGVAS
ncbi:PucR family transcriptional regulator [Amycolatopsis sp. RTGN1]|uniref:PucR family transcriptional regulator n=1 Tax=Amycolatopsis ponsaeliensis TaxID=2992142 RepID=UPI00254BDBF7|nr:PucR family transcriptional regulator [Amycolatopsis sp. RTGN1]